MKNKWVFSGVTNLVLIVVSIFAILLIFNCIAKIEQNIKFITNAIYFSIDYQKNMYSVIAKIIKNEVDLYEKLDKINMSEFKINNSNKIEEHLEKCTVIITDIINSVQGSGVIIKYNENYYILTAYHIIRDLDSNIVLYDRNKIAHIIKKDETKDLALLSIKEVPEDYATLSDNEPRKNAEVYAVGSPIGIEDVITRGRILEYKDNWVYFFDKIFFGSSGGGVYNINGELIGIISHMKVNTLNNQEFIINGATRLNSIKEFLSDIK